MNLKIANQQSLNTNPSMQPNQNPTIGQLSKKRAPRKRFASFDAAALQMKERRSVYIALARKAAIELAMSSPDGTVTIDDVRKQCPPPEEVDPRVMGAVFTERGVWEFQNFERSVRSTCHHRPIQRFKLIGH